MQDPPKHHFIPSSYDPIIHIPCKRQLASLPFRSSGHHYINQSNQIKIQFNKRQEKEIYKYKNIKLKNGCRQRRRDRRLQDRPDVPPRPGRRAPHPLPPFNSPPSPPHPSHPLCPRRRPRRPPPKQRPRRPHRRHPSRLPPQAINHLAISHRVCLPPQVLGELVEDGGDLR